MAVLNEDKPIPQRKPRTRTPPLMDHDKPFKPSNPPKRGYNKSLAPFPMYIEDPLKPVTRKPEDEEEMMKKKFKPSHPAKSRPTPSITTNLRNIKASFPTMFKRWRAQKLRKVAIAQQLPLPPHFVLGVYEKSKTSRQNCCWVGNWCRFCLEFYMKGILSWIHACFLPGQICLEINKNKIMLLYLFHN